MLQQLFRPELYAVQDPPPNEPVRKRSSHPPRFLILCKTADVIGIIWKPLSRPPTDARRSAWSGREHSHVDSVCFTRLTLSSNRHPQVLRSFLGHSWYYSCKSSFYKLRTQPAHVYSFILCSTSSTPSIYSGIVSFHIFIVHFQS